MGLCALDNGHLEKGILLCFIAAIFVCGFRVASCT